MYLYKDNCSPAAYLFAGVGGLGVVDKDLDLPTLPVTGGIGDIPSLTSLMVRGKLTDPTLPASRSPSTAVIVEGLPPIASKLLERIRRWDYVDLADLLLEASAGNYEIPTSSQNQVILVQSLDQMRKKRHILDIETWLQAFSIYAAALTAIPATSKEESTGLLAHMYLITQIAKDLGGMQWYKYDKEFRERAAESGAR